MSKKLKDLLTYLESHEEQWYDVLRVYFENSKLGEIQANYSDLKALEKAESIRILEEHSTFMYITII